MNKTLYYDSNTHQLVIGDCSSNELEPITVEPTLSADTFKISEDGKLQIKINGEYVFVGDRSLIGKEGKEGITPRLKVEAGCLLVSYDNGKEWESLNQIVSDDVAAQFASQAYVRTLPQEHQYPELRTTNDTIIGAINELAALHDMTGTFCHTYSEGSYSVFYKKLNTELITGNQYYVTGNITPYDSAGVCLVVIPNNRNYSDPGSWQTTAWEYNDDIQIVDIGETFNLNSDSTLYLFFTSSDYLKDRIPSAFGYDDVWYVDSDNSPFSEFPATITLTDFKITQVEAVATSYQMTDILAEINSLSEKITQLENELNLANNATVELTNTIASQSAQIVQLQTDLSQATIRINTLEADTVWLEDLDQEEMLKYWSSKTITEE